MSTSKQGGRNKNRGRTQNPSIGDKAKETIEALDTNNPVIQAFQGYSAELDEKHDRYERIIKLSRDITIESKRIIFLLHCLDNESKKESTLKEAETRLEKLALTHFRDIGQELMNQDCWQYLRAFTSGVQEYLEAVTFHAYLSNYNNEPILFPEWNHLQKSLSYENEERGKFYTPITPNDYLLGLADLTGELLRKCITSVGLGRVQVCYDTCKMVRNIYNGFLSIGNSGSREMHRKVNVLRQSLLKMENACYTIHVRGSELPRHMLADAFQSVFDEALDEGFY